MNKWQEDFLMSIEALLILPVRFVLFIYVYLFIFFKGYLFGK